MLSCRVVGLGRSLLVPLACVDTAKARETRRNTKKGRGIRLVSMVFSCVEDGITQMYSKEREMDLSCS